jgi:hypothetical protein
MNTQNPSAIVPEYASPLPSPHLESTLRRDRHRSSGSASFRSSTSDIGASAELLKLVGTLTDENAELKNNIAELQRMLATTQDRNLALRTELDQQEFEGSSSESYSPEASMVGPPSALFISSMPSPSPSAASYEGNNPFGYTLPDGTKKPQSSRRRRSSHRPASMMLPQQSQSKRRHRSVDMATLYDQLPVRSSLFSR